MALPRAGAPAGTFLPNTKVQVGSQRVVIERYLSEGGFAHVYVVRLPKPFDGVDKAVLKRVAVPDKDALASMRTEVETMKKLKGHSHIVRYMDSHASSLKEGGFEVFLLMEYCDGGGLIDFMNTRLQNRLTEPEILKILSDTCQGLASMHYLRPPLLHRDLKVENILITGTGANRQFKLCDFGSTAPPRPAAATADEGRLIEEDIQKNTTMQYRSPEMIDVYRRQPIDEKSDIWALGVFLYKLCYYTTPFEEQGQMAILNASFKYPAYPQFSDRLKRLIAMMLMENPTSRPNIYLVFKEVCAMRNRACPLKDIYSNRTASEARRNQELPSPPRDDTPTGITKVSPQPERRLNVPEVTPMRRGRPTNAGNAVSNDPSPSPGRAPSGDPFAALDGRQGETAQSAAIDELSSKFPSLDQFSLLHDSGGKFAFGSKQAVTSPQLVPPTQPGLKPVSAQQPITQQQPQQQQQQRISQRVTEALADDAFVRRPSSVGPAISQKPVALSSNTGRTNVATQTSSVPITKSSDPMRPRMVSTGTMTTPSPPKSYTPEISSRAIFKVPTRDARSNSRSRSDGPSQNEAPSRASLSAARPPLLEHRSKSQTAMAEVGAATAASAARSDLQNSSADDSTLGSRLENTITRPISTSFESATRFLHGRSPSSKSRPDRTSGILVDTSDAAEPEAVQIDSNVDFLRQMEEDDQAKPHSKRLSGSSLSGFKRSSITASGAKSILTGRLGDAFKRFESSSSSSSAADRQLPPPASDELLARIDGGGLTPIAGSFTADGRSDDGELAIEETEEDLSPEMRRELERRRLSQEERRVADAAAAYKQRIATNGTGGGSGSTGTGSRAAAIQNRVQALLDESAQKSPTRTASGYGKYTADAAPRESVQQQQQQIPTRPAATASAPAATLSADRPFPRPSAPPKPQVLRTGNGGGGIVGGGQQPPVVARKPAKMASLPATVTAPIAAPVSAPVSAPITVPIVAAAPSATGQSLLQQRLALDDANSQAGHGGPQVVAAVMAGSAGSAGQQQGGGGVGEGVGAAPAPGNADAAAADDWETTFSRRYPSLGNLEMEEMKI